MVNQISHIFLLCSNSAISVKIEFLSARQKGTVFIDKFVAASKDSMNTLLIHRNQIISNVSLN